jgi:hypothetical protein
MAGAGEGTSSEASGETHQSSGPDARVVTNGSPAWRKRLEEEAEARRAEARWLKEEPGRRTYEDLEEDMLTYWGGRPRERRRPSGSSGSRKRPRPAGAKPRCGLAWFVPNSQR